MKTIGFEWRENKVSIVKKSKSIQRLCLNFDGISDLILLFTNRRNRNPNGDKYWQIAKLRTQSMKNLKSLKEFHVCCRPTIDLKKELMFNFLLNLQAINSLIFLELDLFHASIKNDKLFKLYLSKLKQFKYLSCLKLNLESKICKNKLEAILSDLKFLNLLTSLEVKFESLGASTSNNFHGAILKLKNLVQLKSLKLTRAIVDENTISSLLSSLNKLNLISNVDLSFTQSRDYHETNLPVFNNVSIENFKLKMLNYSLESQFLEGLFCSLGNCSFLKSLLLDFKDCRDISPQEISLLSSNLKNCKLLTNVDLKFENISGIKTLIPSLLELKDLSQLTLHFGLTEGETRHRLYENLENMTSLKVLDLGFGDDNVEDSEIKFFISIWKKLVNLSILNLHFKNSKISQTAKKMLYWNLKDWSSLSDFNINF